MTEQTTSQEVDRMSSKSDLERQAAHCSQCGYPYNLAPLVDKVVDERLGQCFGKVQDRVKKRISYDLKGFFHSGLAGFSKALGIGAMIYGITKGDSQATIMGGLFYVGGEFGSINANDYYRKHLNQDVLDIKDRLNAYSSEEE